MTHEEANGARFADILTTAAAVADYMGVPDVSAAHLLTALEILVEDRKLEDMGRPVSPMLRRPGQEKGVEPPVRELVQLWFARLEGDANHVLRGDELSAFRQDMRSLTRDSQS